MAELVAATCLSTADRKELEKLCQHLLTFYVRMLEKPVADNIKGSLMSTQNSSSSDSNGQDPEGSSVDPPEQTPSSHAEISGLLEEVHQNIPAPRRDPLPTHLPTRMQQQPFRQNLQDFEQLFPMDHAEEMFEKKELDRVEIMMLYMRSFQNCLECDPRSLLQAVQSEVGRYSLQIRFIGYLSVLLADVMEVCYPCQRLPVLISEFRADLSRYQDPPNPSK